MSLRRRRKGPAGHTDNAGDEKTGNQRSIGIAEDDLMLDDFLAGEDHFFCSKCRFAHDAEISPDVGVARSVGTLNVKNGHIGLNRSDGEEFLSGEGAGNRGKLRALAEIASSDGAGRKKWKSGRCRMQ